MSGLPQSRWRSPYATWRGEGKRKNGIDWASITKTKHVAKQHHDGMEKKVGQRPRASPDLKMQPSGVGWRAWHVSWGPQGKSGDQGLKDGGSPKNKDAVFTASHTILVLANALS